MLEKNLKNAQKQKNKWISFVQSLENILACVWVKIRRKSGEKIAFFFFFTSQTFTLKLNSKEGNVL